MPEPAAPSLPNVAPDCAQVPRRSDEGFDEICHIVTDSDPDTALCGHDVSGYPWNPPWPLCQACVDVADGRMN